MCHSTHFRVVAEWPHTHTRHLFLEILEKWSILQRHIKTFSKYNIEQSPHDIISNTLSRKLWQTEKHFFKMFVIIMKENVSSKYLKCYTFTGHGNGTN